MRNTGDNYRPSEQEVRMFIQAGRLHASSADARLAAAELESAAKRYSGTMAAHYKRFAAQYDAALRAQLEKDKAAFHASLEKYQIAVQDCFADILGAKDSDELLDIMLDRMTSQLGPIVDKAVKTAVTTALVRKMVREEIHAMARDSEEHRNAPTRTVRTMFTIDMHPAKGGNGK